MLNRKNGSFRSRRGYVQHTCIVILQKKKMYAGIQNNMKNDFRNKDFARLGIILNLTFDNYSFRRRQINIALMCKYIPSC